MVGAMEPMINEPVRGTIGDMSFLRLPGLDAMRRAVRGEAPRPPIHHLTGLRPTEAGLGRMTFSMPVTPWLEDAAGIIWGGVFAFFADAPISLALYTGLPPGKLPMTSELSINYLRPATRDTGTMIGRARSVYLGRDVGVSEATIEDRHGRTLAHATTRCVVVDIPFDSDAELGLPAENIDEPADPYLRTPPDSAWSELSVFEGEKVPSMRRFVDGVHPPGPVQLLTGARFMSVEHGRAAMSWPASPWFSAGGPAMYGGRWPGRATPPSHLRRGPRSTPTQSRPLWISRCAFFDRSCSMGATSPSSARSVTPGDRSRLPNPKFSTPTGSGLLWPRGRR